jgi:linoleoyl-CoA desaturase
MDKLNFPHKNDFDQVIKNRVNDYMKTNNIKTTGNTYLHMKALGIVLTIMVSYFLLLFKAETFLSGLLLTFIFVQAQILLAFNVMHDGGHSSFSSKKWLNDVAAKSMDFLGGSSLVWKQKHNSIHHTYTNVSGKDDDLDVGIMMRLSPSQDIKPWYKFQVIYAPFLYSFLSLYLLFYSDAQRFVANKIGVTPLQKYDKKDLIYFICSKGFYLAYALFIPMIWHSPWIVICYFLFAHAILGLTLSIVFQLAHTVEEAQFPVSDEKGDMPYSWIEHQLQTTCNFATNNKLVTFYCGGLNYQIEHHLFHRISHVHYPRISKIVKETCEEYGKPYRVNKSFLSALRSHFSFLKAMGA